MLRGMVFVDHMNFNIAITDYYASLGRRGPDLDYNTIFRSVVGLVQNVSYTKAIIFAPEPDQFLMNDSYLCRYYKWVQGMKNAKYLDVVEGRYIARPVNETVPMDISNKQTYYKVEKGTDINLAIHAISKGYNNAYDVAFIFSADTDYISLYRQLKSMGKLVIVVAVKGQMLKKVIPEVDDFIILDDRVFSQNIRKKQSTTGS